ncbi:Reverse transcriptase zinc-binding domain [Arabidopsis suecica]|uniref:Reverse transcriptase zinc-binding domain n=1 Tax=Arabidopsis suecica TaxID=45249 RepID=A0A8T2AIP6_ARASU|nr:Reverse transcriptase zinc-binding domain [Arabidopsis suecica]
MFLWKLLVKALPLGSTLAARGLISSVTCKRCGGQEDAIHLLLTCPFAARVWELAPVLFKPCPSSVQDPFSLLKAAKKMITLPPVGLSLSPLFPWIWWHLWKARNYLLYEDKVWSDSEVLDKAISDARSWQLAQVLPPKQRTPPASRVIMSPLRKDFVCFVDAAWIATSGNSGMGWVFQDYLGTPIHHGSSSRPFVPSALAAEALAVKKALLSALDHELFHLQVFSDSQTLVRLLNAKESTVELRGILFDISFLRLRFISLSFNFISRLNNVSADSLAKSALFLLNSFSSNGV